jgi:hypothetical protein
MGNSIPDGRRPANIHTVLGSALLGTILGEIYWCNLLLTSCVTFLSVRSGEKIGTLLRAKLSFRRAFVLIGFTRVRLVRCPVVS